MNKFDSSIEYVHMSIWKAIISSLVLWEDEFCPINHFSFKILCTPPFVSGSLLNSWTYVIRRLRELKRGMKENILENCHHSWMLTPVPDSSATPNSPIYEDGTMWDLVLQSVKATIYSHQREWFEFIWIKIARDINLEMLREPLSQSSLREDALSHPNLASEKPNSP